MPIKAPKIPANKVKKATPYSMNSLFSEFFREFSGGILEVCETIWGLFGGHFAGILGGIGG